MFNSLCLVSGKPVALLLGRNSVARKCLPQTVPAAVAMTVYRPFSQTRLSWQQHMEYNKGEAIEQWSKRQLRMLQDQDFTTNEEKVLFKKLLKEYNPAALSVQDISGGCGSMYAIHVTSTKFNDLSIIKQHQMVNDFLKHDLAKWHGMQLVTKNDKGRK